MYYVCGLGSPGLWIRRKWSRDNCLWLDPVLLLCLFCMCLKQLFSWCSGILPVWVPSTDLCCVGYFPRPGHQAKEIRSPRGDLTSEGFCPLPCTPLRRCLFSWPFSAFPPIGKQVGRQLFSSSLNAECVPGRENNKTRGSQYQPQTLLLSRNSVLPLAGKVSSVGEKLLGMIVSGRWTLEVSWRNTSTVYVTELLVEERSWCLDWASQMLVESLDSLQQNSVSFWGQTKLGKASLHVAHDSGAITSWIIGILGYKTTDFILSFKMTFLNFLSGLGGFLWDSIGLK